MGKYDRLAVSEKPDVLVLALLSNDCLIIYREPFICYSHSRVVFPVSWVGLVTRLTLTRLTMFLFDITELAD